MLVYEIEDSRDGLMGAVFCSYKNKESPDLIVVGGQAFQSDFSTSVRKIETTSAIVKRVENGVRERLSELRLEELDCAFMSGEEGKYTIIFNFLRLLFDEGKTAADMLSNPAVIAYNDIILRTSHEAHLWRGFVRFKETVEGYYYAQIQPVNNVLKMLMPHFVKRYQNMYFAIHDINRNIIGIYNTKGYKVLTLTGKIEIALSEEETEFLGLWKQYFINAAIKERKNKRLQSQLLPRHFRKTMDEIYENFDPAE